MKKNRPQQQILMFEWDIIDIIFHFLCGKKWKNFKNKPLNNKVNINIITMIQSPIKVFSKNLKKVNNKIIKTELNIPILKALIIINFHYQIFSNKDSQKLKKYK